jgi:uncharacterized protein (TIGR02246 family)
MLRWFTFLLYVPLLLAQGDDVRAVMTHSEEAWNRGDLAAFASYYDDSPETTFMGREVVRGGVQAVLSRYRKAYPTRENMGTLSFSNIDVRMLAPDIARRVLHSGHGSVRALTAALRRRNWRPRRAHHHHRPR